ncbi:MAG: DUF4912 domain-containing protein [Helicobacteraceae bacterium]|jgi:hypothetical protein|nr:DUF4912 domain-containing protein [Helicobacteraceae bacterium]
MSNNTNPLIKLESSSPSSGGDKPAIAPEINQNDITIADRYYENKLVLLPVNAKTQHFYWEIGDEPLERRIVTRENNARLIIRLYYIVGDRKQEVESVYSNAPKGNYYAYHSPDTLDMEAELFVSDDGGERKILTSNRISTPSSGMHSSPWEIWMTKNGKSQKLESRPSEFDAQGTLANLSSLDIVVREEKLKARVGDMAFNLPSSLNPSSLNPSSDASSGGRLFSGGAPTKEG